VEVTVDGPVGRAGGRGPSALSAGRGAEVALGPLAPGQRWSVARKREVVLRRLRGESGELLSRELGVPLYRLERWRERAQAAIDAALKDRETDAESVELSAALKRVGELSMENELLRARIGQSGPLARRRSR